MGLHDRPYWRDDFDQGGKGFGTIVAGMPKPTSVVKWLLIANLAVSVLQIFFDRDRAAHMSQWLAVTGAEWWQLWRYVTFQFLHGGLFHLLFNMLGLYLLGRILEESWGPKRFLVFYLSCGAFAGLCHVVMTFAFSPAHTHTHLIGASGGVFAVVLACAILFPQIRLILLFFPVPIRFAAALFIGIAVFNLLSGIAGGGFVGGISDAAHLGGAVAGVFWVWGLPRLRRGLVSTRIRRGKGAWHRKLKKQADEQVEIDAILHKIHEQGIGSLTSSEKRILKNASRQQQQEENNLGRL
jgi:membrane associated rhomboid family serine protease